LASIQCNDIKVLKEKKDFKKFPKHLLKTTTTTKKNSQNDKIFTFYFSKFKDKNNIK